MASSEGDTEVECEEGMHKEGAPLSHWATPACVLCGEAGEVLPEEDDRVVQDSEGTSL